MDASVVFGPLLAIVTSPYLMGLILLAIALTIGGDVCRQFTAKSAPEVHYDV